MDIFNHWVEEGEREAGSWSWEEDLLKAVSGDPCLHHQPPAEEEDTDMLNTPDMLTEEFVAPPEVEAEWDLHSELVGMKDPHPSEEELFRGYNYKLVSPTEVEGRASNSTITDLHCPPPLQNTITTTTTTTNNNQPEVKENPVTLATILPEPLSSEDMDLDIGANESHGEALIQDLSSIWNPNFMDAFDSIISNNNITAEVDNPWNTDNILKGAEPDGPMFDIVEYAMDESGVCKENESTALYPVPDVKIEVLEEVEEEEKEVKPIRNRIKKENKDHDYDPNLKKVKKNPSTPHKMKRKKVGRPARGKPIEVTQIPTALREKLSEVELTSLKYRRMRDLNNEASRKCRENRKKKAATADVEMELEMEKNRQLKATLEKMSMQKDMLAKKLKALGLCSQ